MISEGLTGALCFVPTLGFQACNQQQEVKFSVRLWEDWSKLG